MLNSKKLLAAAAAGFIALNTAGITTFAEGETTVNNQQGNLVVSVTKNPNSYNPAGNVTFNEILVSPATGQKPDNNASAIYKGLEGGLLFTPATFAGGTEGLNANSATATGTVKINPSVFATAPQGQYLYQVKPSTKIDGVTLDSEAVVNISVYKDNTGKLLMTINNGAAKSTNGEFVEGNSYTTYTLTVTKLVTGNQSVDSHTFPFTVDLTSSDSGEAYNVTTLGATQTSGNNKTTVTKNLGDKDTIVVNGLSKADLVKIGESYGNLEGYTTTIEGASTSAESQLETVDAKMGEKDRNVTFTNEKKGTVPTGIIMSAAPFAGMIGLGGIFAGLFFRKKRED